jgi:hypothetical protein
LHIDPHRIDPFQWEGLLEIVHFGNVIELSHMWNPAWYSKPQKQRKAKEISTIREEYLISQEKAQIDHIHGRYLDFQRDFSENYRFKKGDELLIPRSEIFDPSIIQLAVSICKYKRSMGPKFDSRFTAAQLTAAVEKHFQETRPSLYEPLKADLQRRDEALPYLETLTWKGGAYEIVRAEQGMCRFHLTGIAANPSRCRATQEKGQAGSMT